MTTKTLTANTASDLESVVATYISDNTITTILHISITYNSYIALYVALVIH